MTSCIASLEASSTRLPKMWRGEGGRDRFGVCQRFNCVLTCFLPQRGTKAELHDACLVMDTLGGRTK